MALLATTLPFWYATLRLYSAIRRKLRPTISALNLPATDASSAMKIQTILFSALLAAAASSPHAEVWNPYDFRQPDSIDQMKGYCTSASHERALWSAINKFSQSFLTHVPAVSLEQKKQLDDEMRSTVPVRWRTAMQSPLHQIDTIRESVEQLENLSARYLEHQQEIGTNKKMRYIGQALDLLTRDLTVFGSADTAHMPFALARYKYAVPEQAIATYYSARYGLLGTLHRHLICYGELRN